MLRSPCCDCAPPDADTQTEDHVNESPSPSLAVIFSEIEDIVSYWFTVLLIAVWLVLPLIEIIGSVFDAAVMVIVIELGVDFRPSVSCALYQKVSDFCGSLGVIVFPV